MRSLRASLLPSLVGGAWGWVFLLLSCSSDLPEQSEVQQPIGFRAEVIEGGTRTVGAGELTTALLQTEGFGVYCWYTGTANFTTPKPTSARTGSTQPYLMLMRNQKVMYEGGAWNYSPSKYWPEDPDEKLTFRAYAPYRNYLVTDANGMPQLPVVVAATDYHNGTQHDPLWGTGKRGGTDNDAGTTYGLLYDNYTFIQSGNDLSKDSRDRFIDWYFHHGMAKFILNAKLDPTSTVTTFTVNAITLSPLYNQGLLDISSPATSATDKPNWTDGDGDMTIALSSSDLKSGVTIAVGDDFKPLLDYGVLVIPRDYSNGTPGDTSDDTPLIVTVSYTADGVDQTVRARLSDFIDAARVEGNTVYSFNLTINPILGSIAVTLRVDLYWQVGSYGLVDNL